MVWSNGILKRFILAAEKIDFSEVNVFLVAILIFCLPFEQILVLNLGPATIKPSQIITLILTFQLTIFCLARIKKGLFLLAPRLFLGKEISASIENNKQNLIKNPPSTKNSSTHSPFMGAGGYFKTQAKAPLNQKVVIQFTPIICLLLFWLFSSTSWFFATDFSRLAVNFIATSLCVLAAICIFVSGKAGNLLSFKWLILVFWLLSLFALYQFFGDMIGLGTNLTLLRPQYTKIIFGIPRVHTTTLEPLYWSGMLTIPWFYYFWQCFLEIVSPSKYPNLDKLTKIFPFCYFQGNLGVSQKRAQTIPPLPPLSRGLGGILTYIWKLRNFTALFWFSLSFLLPYAKSSILILSLALLFFLILLFFSNRNLLIRFLSKFPLKAFSLVLICTTLIFASSSLIPGAKAAYLEIFRNFAGSLTGESTSSMERDRFFTAAMNRLGDNWLFGIGNGQYGIVTRYQLGDLNTDLNNFSIVNNAYLEVWLENGLLSFSFFVLFWLLLLVGLHLKSKKMLEVFTSKTNPSQDTPKNYFAKREKLVVTLTVFASLLFYLGQWLYFSPVYYMPVFILAGVGLVAIFKSK